MGSRLLQVLLALSLLLNAFILVGFIYRSWIMPPPPPFERPMPPPGPRPSPLEMVARELNLDDAQRQALKSVFDQYTAMRHERLQEILKLREQLAGEYKQPNIDLARVDGLIDQLSKLRSDFQKDTLRAFTQLEGQLNPEQRERMHHILAERLSGPPMRPPPGSPPRPGAGSGRPPRPSQ